MSEHKRAYRRVTKALRLAQSGEADSIVAAAKEILSTRIKHGDVLRSPTAVRDYLRLLLHDREHEVSMTTRASMRLRTHSSDKHSSRNLPLKLSSAPFRQGLPGSISAALICCRASQSRMAWLTNSRLYCQNACRGDYRRLAAGMF